MATPAQIANDMASHARYWQKRDKAICQACRDAARLIWAYQGGTPVDGRTYYGLHRRLLDLAHTHRNSHYIGVPDFDRARIVLEQLKAERRQ